MRSCVGASVALPWQNEWTAANPVRPVQKAASARESFPRGSVRRVGRGGARSAMTDDDSAVLNFSPAVIDDPDAELVAKVAEGDQAACRELVLRHLRGTYSLARRMLGNDADAEEVAQETFLRAWRHAPRWQPGRARFETWLYRVTLNLCYDRLRRRREVTMEVMPEVTDPTPSVIETHHRREVAEAVQNALAALPERQRAALVLCHYQGLTNIQAAEALTISVDALESLLARGRRALKALLADRAADLLGEL